MEFYMRKINQAQTPEAVFRRPAVQPSLLRWNCLLLLLLLAYAFSPVLFAQAKSEEFMLVKSYKLPATAIAFSELKTGPGDTALKPMLYKGEPFNGTTFERYKNKALSRVQSYKNGILDGPSYVWYPDGSPQMYVNYRQGLLSGRFLGWYMHGGILYDMVINAQGYAGDYIEDGRSGEASGDEEGEGDAQVNEKE